ncbi:MAG: hypothetical protein JNJ78_10995 [Anaerolineae bacterium]|nr:hypothetical protein [Anaerolineae bacterium]
MPPSLPPMPPFPLKYGSKAHRAATPTPIPAVFHRRAAAAAAANQKGVLPLQNPSTNAALPLTPSTAP